MVNSVFTDLWVSIGRFWIVLCVLFDLLVPLDHILSAFDYYIWLPIGSLSLGFYVYIGITLSLIVIYHSFSTFSIRNIV